MNKRIPIAGAILLCLLAGGYFIDRTRHAKESVLSGFFESQPSSAASRIGGRVVQVLVHEGDTVGAGQALIRLEAASYSASAQAQSKAAEQARQQLLEVRNGPRAEEIAKARHGVEEAGALYEKLRRGARPEEIAIARAKVRQGEAQLRKVLAGPRPEEIAAAAAAADAALARLQQAERGLTQEERNELKARLGAARSEEVLAKKQLDRIQFLTDQGAAPKQHLDAAIAAHQQAVAKRVDAEQAFQRAERGTPEEELAQARHTYRQARAQYLLVKRGSRAEDIDAVRQDVEGARQSLALVLSGARPEDVNAAKARLQQAEAALAELLHGSRREEIARARAAHEQAVLQARSADINRGESTITATAPARVDRILVADGDLVAIGAPVVQLSYPDDVWLRVYLPEADLPKIKQGDSGELSVDGIAGGISAIVESIAARGEFTPANLQSPEERGKQVFAVKLRLAHPDPRIKAGMYATVRRLGKWSAP